jgi:signal transduction histidine kinase/DNA-binding response OmpR family regulator
MSDTDKVNILVVDDLPEKILVMETILGELGENIVGAQSGEEALRLVLQHEFAVILLDVNMPGMDGFETAAFIRRRKKSAHTPIIFITAFADEMHTAQGYSLGAVDYILSPVVPEILRTKVSVFVELARMTQQVKRQAEEHIALAREQAARAAAEEATRRSSFLAEAGKVLSSSLDFRATLRGLARLVVPFLADLGAVTEVDENGQPCRTEVAWATSDQEVHRAACVGRDGLTGPLEGAVRHALAGGNPAGLSEPGSWAPPAVEAVPDQNGQPQAPGAFAVRHTLALPLLARGRTLGVLTLALGPSAREYGPADVALAEDLAGRAATALDNARLYRNIQEGDRRKDEFLAMLAHELRNPLAPIRNAVQVLRLVGLHDPAVVQARDMIDRQVTHMARLIDDLLDMSRLSRGKILLRKERLDLVQLVRATVEDYRGMLESTGLNLRVSLPEGPLYTHGDPTRLAQVVGNVLHNANKFTDAGGTVTVELAAAAGGREAVIAVRDSGIGMEPDVLARVFEAFSQADRSLDRSRGGLGLGLALVRGLVELHGGQVSVSSEGPGKGTALTIRLPLGGEAAPARPAAPPPRQTRLARRVLVIEDNPDSAESMRMLLALSGHQVEVAPTGVSGVERARTFRPEVVLCDIGLPGGMDGYAVARALRADPALSAAYLIASTGYGQVEDQRRSREAGFDAHLTKPIDFAELQRLLAASPTQE